MTTTFTQTQGSRSASPLLSMSTLGSGDYIGNSTGIDMGSAIPLDNTIEVEVTPSATPSGSQQLFIFAQLSLDNSNYGTGPTSGSSDTDQRDLQLIGVFRINSSGTHRKFFSLAGLPVARFIKFVVKNDLGVTLTSGYIYMAAITGVAT